MSATANMAASQAASVIAATMCQLELEEGVDAVSDETVHIIAQKQEQHPETQRISGDFALISIVKGNLGVGILALPLAFRQGGLWFALFTTIVLMIGNWHMMHSLVKCSRYMSQKFGKHYLDYGHLAKAAFDCGGLRFQKYSRASMYAVNVFSDVMQVGGGACALVFVAQNIEKALKYFIGSTYTLDTRALLAIVFFLVLCLAMIRDLKLLTNFALVGNFLTLFAFCFIFANLFTRRNVYYADDFWFHNTTRFFQYFSTAMYAVEAQAELLPLYNSMIVPSDMTRSFGVLDTSMALVAAVYLATGFFGYLSYGDSVQGSITLNMPNIGVFNIVNIAYSLSVTLSHPMHVYMVVAILWPSVLRRLPVNCYPNRFQLEYLFRFIHVLLQFLVATCVPRLDLLLPLVGAISGISLAFIFPPLLEMLTFWHVWALDRRTFFLKLMVAKNLLFIIVGLIGVVGGTVVNLQAIVEAFQDNTIDD